MAALGPKEVAGILGCGPRRARELMLEGKISSFYVGKRIRCFPEDLDRYIERSRIFSGARAGEGAASADDPPESKAA